MASIHMKLGLSNSKSSLVKFVVASDQELKELELKTAFQDGPTDEKKILLSILLKLKQIDVFLQSDDCQPPTSHELRLYGMILRHVETYILLFRKEKFCELTKEAAAYRGNVLTDSDDVSGDSMGDELFRMIVMWDDVMELLNLCRSLMLKEACPLEASATPVDIDHCEVTVEKSRIVEEGMPAAAGSCSQSVISCKPAQDSTLEKCLLFVLQVLETIGSRRSYSPSGARNISFYWEIGQVIASSLSFIDSKAEWQKKHAIKAQGSEKWISVFQGCHYYGNLTDPFRGWKHLIALDVIPNLISDIEESESDLKYVHSSQGKQIQDFEQGEKSQTFVIDVSMLAGYERTAVGINTPKKKMKTHQRRR